MRGKTIIIQGGQYGSEGKGQIAAEVAHRENVRVAVRTGSINAGHTVYRDGKKFSMQIIPTPWVYPDITLVLGAGTYIEPSILAAEVDFIKEATGEDIRHRLLIDERCVWFGEKEHAISKAANRHHAMGATGKGCSEAIVSKMRDRSSDETAQARLFSHFPGAAQAYNFVDTVDYLSGVLEQGHNVLLEGTQGSLLDFNTGPYPYVTSRMTSSAAWLAEAGLPPINVMTVLVVRSHPIRVAGNSGPMPSEITWPILARRINHKRSRAGLDPLVDEVAISDFELALKAALLKFFPDVAAELGEMFADQFHLWSPEQRVRHRVCLSEANSIALRTMNPDSLAKLQFFEKTTVTKKLRRIAELDFDEVRRAIQMNGPSQIAYTFLNYDMPELTNVVNYDEVANVAAPHICSLSTTFGVPVTYVSTGPLPEHVISV